MQSANDHLLAAHLDFDERVKRNVTSATRSLRVDRGNDIAHDGRKSQTLAARPYLALTAWRTSISDVRHGSAHPQHAAAKAARGCQRDHLQGPQLAGVVDALHVEEQHGIITHADALNGNEVTHARRTQLSSPAMGGAGSGLTGALD